MRGTSDRWCDSMKIHGTDGVTAAWLYLYVTDNSYSKRETCDSKAICNLGASEITLAIASLTFPYSHLL